ncbi:hypothetical protein [Pedobacter sp. CG_S7]|uniref:hypothetical protein n=1 Tax=Pedobacter sp. CG_S7 TaxID=3143930 RepID=UPI003390B0F1
MKKEEDQRLYKKEVRFNKAEKDFIESIVEKNGSNFSAYTRKLYYRNEATVKLELSNSTVSTDKRDFQNLCNNFNQLVKHMHQTGIPIPDVAHELDKILKAVRDGYSKNM